MSFISLLFVALFLLYFLFPPDEIPSLFPSDGLYLSMPAAVDCGSVIMGPEEECLFAIHPPFCAVCLLADTTDFDPQ